MGVVEELTREPQHHQTELTSVPREGSGMARLESPPKGSDRGRRRGLALSLGLCLMLIAFPHTSASQSDRNMIVFPGAVTIQWKLDEMTDQKRCTIRTPGPRTQAAVSAADEVSFWVPEGSLVSARRDVLARIDSDPPIVLEAAETPRVIHVPREDSHEIVKALYQRSKVLVRYYTFPEQTEINTQITVGEFSSAYDYAVDNCGWQEVNISAPPLPRNADVYEGDGGYVSAMFGGQSGWNVILQPKYQSCRLSAGVVHSIVNYEDKESVNVVPLGVITFYSAAGEEVGKIRQYSFAPGPVGEFIRLARDAGERGWVKLDNGELFSLYGLTEALSFLKRNCGVELP